MTAFSHTILTRFESLRGQVSQVSQVKSIVKQLKHFNHAVSQSTLEYVI